MSLRPAVRRLAAALLACLLFAGGCASPTTGRVRDAHLLWEGDPAKRQIASFEQFGPFYQRVETADGAVRRSVRPFLWTGIESAEPGVSHEEILGPVWARERRAGQTAWRFLIFFGMDKDVTGEGSPQDRTWLFPLWFSGTTRDGEDYAALFPIHGTIREMYWERIGFTLFPLWVTWDRNDSHTWSVLWPFVQRQKGPKRDAWRILPFWGRTRVEGERTSHFVMWPIWTDSEHVGRNPGSEWMLWPLVGRVDRQDEDAWLFLPPLFNFSYGRGKLPEYRKVNCPWPIVMIHDDKDGHERRYFPFWMHRWTEDGKAENLTVLWPFWNQRRVDVKNRRDHEWTLFPILHQSVLTHVAPDGTETLEENYLRVWPLYSRRYDPERRLVRIPDLSFRKREGQLERNLLGMFTLYTRGEQADPHRVDHEALWGMFRRGYGEDYSATRVWPFYDTKEEDGAWHWSILGGLLGRSGRGDESAWHYLWFFGDRLDETREEAQE